MIVAAVGIGVNAFTAWLFMKGKKNDLNIRSAFVHFMADALVSLGVVIAGIIMTFTGIQWIDSLVSFAIIAVILYSSYKLLIDSVNLALDAVPDNIKIDHVLEYFANLPEVTGVHDLHIWSLGTTDAALTVHLTTSVQTNVSFISSIQHSLNEQFNIEHSTIQVEFGGMEDCGNKF
jgi:cobalt-zinc-cadmium efflux system protein